LSSDDPQTAYNHFSDTFTNFYSPYFPIKTIKFNRNIHKLEPWISKGLLISRCNKLKLSNLAAKKPTPSNIDTFKTYRNIYNKLIRTAKKFYCEKELEKNKKNLKRTWDIICNALNKTNAKNSPFSELVVGGISYMDPLTIANKLNKFFTTIPSEIVGEIPPLPLDHSNNLPPPLFGIVICLAFPPLM
jgi:hypothetical protein